MNNKRLAKNTIMLYTQMLVSMVIALYTSRVVLQTLGVDDYGLYNVVGGVVSMITIITGGMATATQRFLSFELGKSNNEESLKLVFNTCVFAHVFIALIFLVVSETLGLWFLNNYIQIPLGREFAAVAVYHFSVITVCVNLILSPFSACILSHEKVSIYACIGILDSILKLVIALGIAFATYDKLFIYGCLMMLISVVNFIIYKSYCSGHYKETKLKLVFDKDRFKSIFSFASYTILGQGGMVAANQGTNILVNMFHSVRANAAMAIATQVNGALSGIISNFYLAYQPQITKSYSSGDESGCRSLIYSTSKLSFYLVFLVSIPVILNIEWILKIWLGNVPDGTSAFCVFFILSSMINSFGNPFMTGVYATGSIKKLQLLSTLLYLGDIVLVYVLFSMGLPAVWGPISKFIIDCLMTTLRVFVARQQLSFISISEVFIKLICPIVATVITTLLVSVFICYYLSLSGIPTTIIVIFTAITVLYMVGLSKAEKVMIKTLIENIKAKL